jgi:hypothetical protein
MAIEKISLFETSICKLHNEELAKKLLPVCDYFTTKSETTLFGVRNYPSTLQNNKLRDEVNQHPVVQETFSYIFDNLQEVACLSPVSEIISDVTPYGFFSSMDNGAYLRKHKHLHCNYSGCMYLDIGIDAPGITFFDPNPYSTGIIKYTAEQLKPGTLLIWPKWLEHEIDQKLNDSPRKVFTFNV